MDEHSLTTYGRTAGGNRNMVPDDLHLTLRFGYKPKILNLAGHLYIKTDNGRDDGIPTQVMGDDDRSWVGGYARVLWIWGPYPSDTTRYPRPSWVHAQPPFILKPGRKIPGSGK